MRSLALALFVLVACSVRSFDASDRAAIEALLGAQAQAWNAGDLEGFMVAYEHSDALVFTSAAEVQRGWQATHDRYVARYGGTAGTSAMGHLAFEVLEIRGLGADGAIVLGRWTLTETPKAGTGIFSLALERGDTGWRIVHDHTSARAPD